MTLRPTPALLLLALLTLGAARPALAEAPPSAVTFELRDTFDLWRNASGGLRASDTALNKLQISAAFDGAAFQRPGFKARLAYFHTSGHPLSAALSGDIQTASNIEALPTDRLFEAWAEQDLGHGLVARAGLMDLNADFDSIDPAGLFIDSSHGIGPDLSKSGLNGPSIFPVSALGAHLTAAPTPTLTLRAAVFDGVAGDPDHPTALAAVRLRRSDGALLIGQADLKLPGGAQASAGAWTYTAAFNRIGLPGQTQRGEGGAYAYLEGPVPNAPDWNGWLRVGAADPHTLTVSGYLGAGLVKTAPLPGRDDDQLGLAVSHAVIGGPARRAANLPDTEATFEATYQLKLTPHFAIQPDVQYVIHPAAQAGLRNATIIGLRFSLAFKRPEGGG